MAKRPAQRAPSTQVIMTALNKSEEIPPAIKEIKGSLYAPKILVAIGKGVDQTSQIIKTLGAKIVFQDDHTKTNTPPEEIKISDRAADYVVIIDADFTYPASLIPNMIRILERTPIVGMVCGKGFADASPSRFLNGMSHVDDKSVTLIHSFLDGAQLIDPLTGLRVMRASALKGWRVKSRGFGMEIELDYRVEWEGFGIVEVPVSYRGQMARKNQS